MTELPPWMSGKGERRNQNSRSRKQEQKRAKELGGRTQAGSGSSWRAPEDVISPEVLEQIKYTDKDGFRVTVAELGRVLANAEMRGREPSLCVEFSQHKIRFIARIERIS